MASLQEIKARIGNVESTKKITRAMYLISASKSQKAKSQLEGAFPYFEQIKATLAEIVACSEELDTPFIAGKEPPTAQGDLYLVLGGDKGMAGGYNHNLISALEETADPAADTLLVAGHLGRIQLRHQGYRIDEAFDYPVMNPSVYRAREVAEAVIQHYRTGRYRAVWLVFTEMISSLKQQPTRLQLLPLDTAALSKQAVVHSTEVEYVPNARAVFDQMVPHYLKGIVYSAFVEAFASEQQARMVAMDGATKNADDTISRLTIVYNRARQAKITQELTEIIGGIPQG